MLGTPAERLKYANIVFHSESQLHEICKSSALLVLFLGLSQVTFLSDIVKVKLTRK